MSSLIRRFFSPFTASSSQLQAEKSCALNWIDLPKDGDCSACPYAEPPPPIVSQVNQTKDLRSSFKPYAGHVLLCAGQSGTEWPSHVRADKMEKKGSELPADQYAWMDQLVDTVEEEQKQRWIYSWTDWNPSSMESDWHLVLLPRMMSVRVQRQWTRDTPIDIIKNKLKPILLGSQGTVTDEDLQPHCTVEPLKCQQLILVCTHGSRDKRCGIIGSMIVDALKQELEKKQLSADRVQVYGISHVGGHQYAGNVLVYPEGVWYGRVLPKHVPTLVQEHIENGRVIRDLYRGHLNQENSP